MSSVNYCFKSPLLHFLFEHSDYFTQETRHIDPPYIIVSISKFHQEFLEFDEFQISVKCYSPFSSYWIILRGFFTRETKHIEPSYNENGVSLFCLKFLEFDEFLMIPDFFKTLLLLRFILDHSEFIARDTRHIKQSRNKLPPEIPEVQQIPENANFLKMLLFFQFLLRHSEFLSENIGL